MQVHSDLSATQIVNAEKFEGEGWRTLWLAIAGVMAITLTWNVMNSDHTLEEVGQQFSVTRERIRQIGAKAIRKLPACSIVWQAARIGRALVTAEPTAAVESRKRGCS